MTKAPEATEESPVAEPVQQVVAAPESAPQSTSRKQPQTAVEMVIGVLSSYGLTCIILLALMVLTYFGTYAQISIGLAAAQREYFNSWLAVIDVQDFVPWPPFLNWPGGMLLLSLLSVNLLVGGIVRMRWRLRTVGILIVHFGIVLLMVSSLVTYVTSTRGALTLYEGEQGKTYVSFDEWELVVGEPRADGTVREPLVADTRLSKQPRIQSDSLPFDIVVREYHVNSQVLQAQTALALNAVDGAYLERRAPASESNGNRPGARIDVLVPGQPPQSGIVWGMQFYPLTVQVNGVPWTIDLRRQVFDLPFALRLEEFIKEDHPPDAATNRVTPRKFASDVMMLAGGIERPFHIAMNEPMRQQGFMFSQNSWGPPSGVPPLFSTLEVSSNPSDQWPKYACYVIALGMLFHFGRKLYLHVQKQRRSLTA